MNRSSVEENDDHAGSMKGYTPTSAFVVSNVGMTLFPPP